MKKVDSRFLIHIGCTLGGVLVILGVSLYLIVERLAPQWPPNFTEARLTLGLIVFGFLLNQAGVWRLSHRILPDRRVYMELRRETDVFIDLVRKLNRSRVAGDEVNAQALIEMMHKQVGRLEESAGKKAAVEEELPAQTTEPATASK